MSSPPEDATQARCETDEPQEETGQISMQENTRTDEPKHPVVRYHQEDLPGGRGVGTFMFKPYLVDDDTDGADADKHKDPQQPIPKGRRYIQFVDNGMYGETLSDELVCIDNWQDTPPLGEEAKERVPSPSPSPSPLVADNSQLRRWSIMLVFFISGMMVGVIYNHWRQSMAMEGLQVHITLGAREETGV